LKILFIAALWLTLGGCGLRGDLYLPPAPDAMPAGEAAAAPSQPEPDDLVEATEAVDSASDPEAVPMAEPGASLPTPSPGVAGMESTETPAPRPAEDRRP
jgi:predicted small lipoprotein YifL